MLPRQTILSFDRLNVIFFFRIQSGFTFAFLWEHSLFQIELTAFHNQTLFWCVSLPLNQVLYHKVVISLCFLDEMSFFSIPHFLKLRLRIQGSTAHLPTQMTVIWLCEAPCYLKSTFFDENHLVSFHPFLKHYLVKLILFQLHVYVQVSDYLIWQHWDEWDLTEEIYFSFILFRLHFIQNKAIIMFVHDYQNSVLRCSYCGRTSGDLFRESGIGF